MVFKTFLFFKFSFFSFAKFTADFLDVWRYEAAYPREAPGHGHALSVSFVSLVNCLVSFFAK